MKVILENWYNILVVGATIALFISTLRMKTETAIEKAMKPILLGCIGAIIIITIGVFVFYR